MREKRMLGMIFTMLFLLLITGMRAEAETIDYGDGTWEGTVEDGLPQGFGTLYRQLDSENVTEKFLKTMLGGASYDMQIEGFWYKGILEGPGIITFQTEEDEIRCEGFWRSQGMWGPFVVRVDDGVFIFSSLIDGLYVCLHEDGEILAVRAVEGGESSGMELENWTGDDGITYYAESRADIVGGKGVAIYQNGDIYIGNFLHGKPEGNGVYYWDDGDWYSGSFHDGDMDGAGFLYEPRTNGFYGSCQTGFWDAGQLKGGAARYVFNGVRRISWVNMDGRGIAVYIQPDGEKVIREWDGNETANHLKKEVWIDPNGRICAGERKGDYVDGYGVMVEDEEIYIGYVVNGVESGSGYKYESSGLYYEGEWKDGECNRTEKFYFSDGSSAQITYEKGWELMMCICLDGSWFEIKNDSDTNKLKQTKYVTVLDDGSRRVDIAVEGEDIQQNPGVTIYKDTGYSGHYAVFEPGEYHMADMVKRGISNDSITSITIPEGYSITVYHNDDFSGIRHRYTSDVDFYITGEDDQTRWNDSVSSFIVEKTGQE